MTAPEDAVKRAHRAYYESTTGRPWSEALRVESRHDEAMRAALAAAGVGTTTVEWGVKYTSGPSAGTAIAVRDEANARYLSTHDGEPQRVLVSREVTEWKEADR